MQVPSSYIPISVNSTNNFKQQKPQKFGFLLDKEQSRIMRYFVDNSKETEAVYSQKLVASVTGALQGPKSDIVLYEFFADSYKKMAAETTNPIKKWYYLHKQKQMTAGLLSTQSLLL